MKRERGLRLGVMLPAWSVYALGVLFIGIALAIPWLVRWQGLLRGDLPPQAASGPGRALRPVMLRLPAGEFWMGSAADDVQANDNERPQHRVFISPFLLCQTEVTQGQWEAVMGEKPSCEASGCGDELPVHSVSWFDAIVYLNRLSEREEMTPCYERTGDTVRWDRSCDGYRLPTEAEWEYAARARSRTAYEFGDDVSKLGEYAWFDGNVDDGTAREVGTKQENAWFLHDMHGNVWEWVWDWYQPSYEPQGAVTRNPTGPTAQDALLFGTYIVEDGDPQQITAKARVLRGGSAFVTARNLRSAYRGVNPPSDRSRLSGFRCTRGLSPTYL